ncbi:MAG: pseudaminic acid cytidylyltransferase [Urechidicola sp.]|jgi:N-acylneuraminate cytidylyltransferase
MSKLAIIPARGGSKRIPRKNIKNFLGKPIIAYAIENAINSQLFDEIMVSTDDEVIAEIALSYGAKVPFKRSEKNSSDSATTIDVIKEVIFSYEKLGRHFEYASCIYPCTPLLSKEKLKESFYLLKKSDLDCVFPIIKYGFPIQRAVRLNDKGLIEMFQPEHLITRSQDLESSFHDAGQFYSFNVNNLVSKQKLITKLTGHIEVSEMEAQDIDNLVDWQLAELKYKIINNI